MTPPNNYTQERDRLVEELTEYMPVLAEQSPGHIHGIADFILADRKRIVAPLKDIDEADLTKAEKQILKNSGVEL